MPACRAARSVAVDVAEPRSDYCLGQETDGPQDCGSTRLWSSRLWLLTAVVIVAAERVCTT